MAPRLPVSSLSISSIRKLRQCPEAWRRQYIQAEYSPPSGPMIAGSAAGAAANAADFSYIESEEFLPVDDTLDVFSDEWDERVEAEKPRWGKDKPGEVKDATTEALRSYMGLLDGLPKPIAVEREARLVYEGIEFVAYLDREHDDGSIGDRKVKGKPLSQYEADGDLQPTGYMAVRRAEAEAGWAEEPTSFSFHVMVRQKTKRYAKVIDTSRSTTQLDTFLSTLYSAAEEIEWRMENDTWAYAPDGAWWCSQKTCGYWRTCPGGGLGRELAAEAVRNG